MDNLRVTSGVRRHRLVEQELGCGYDSSSIMWTNVIFSDASSSSASGFQEATFSESIENRTSKIATPNPSIRFHLYQFKDISFCRDVEHFNRTSLLALEGYCWLTTQQIFTNKHYLFKVETNFTYTTAEASRIYQKPFFWNMSYLQSKRTCCRFRWTPVLGIATEESWTGSP